MQSGALEGIRLPVCLHSFVPDLAVEEKYLGEAGWQHVKPLV